MEGRGEGDSGGTPALRQDLIDKAIGFLTHPKVQDTPLSRKRDFLREKKGMTEAEIDEAVRRAGVTDTQSATTGFIPASSSRPSARVQEEDQGFGWASIFAGVVAVASLAVAGLYAYKSVTGNAASTEKKGKKDGKSKAKKTPAKETPASSKKSVSFVPPKEKEEISPDVASAVANGVNEDSSKFAAELERLMTLVEENNRQKFELVRATTGMDESLKADVQTIKSLLLTRQQIGGAVAGVPLPSPAVSVVSNMAPAPTPAPAPTVQRDESSPPDPATVAPTATTTTTTTTTAATPATTAVAPVEQPAQSTPLSAKPWEVRRRNRLESSSASGAAVAPLSTSTSSPSLTTSGVTEAPPAMIPVPNPSTTMTPVSNLSASNSSNRLGDEEGNAN